MRFNKLGLTAFGKFTNAQLDFGDRPAAGPDLHIVYGPNEAGKSTIYAAMLDFFFGIPRKSTFNFKHPYSTMRIDGTVEVGAVETILTRIKQPKNDLLDGAGQPVTLNPFATGLTGLGRDSYAAMFSLNDASLTEGGESLLAAEGDFGRILYGASAGLTDFGKELDTVMDEADAFHKERARNTELRALSHTLEALAQQKAEIDTLAPEYERLRASKALAADALAAAEAAAHTAQARLAQLQNQEKAIAYLSEYKEIYGNLEQLNHLPEAPAGLDRQVTRLREEAASLNAQSADAAVALKALEDKIEAIIVDEQALGQVEAFAALSDLAGRHRADAGDLPRRIEEQTGLSAQIAARSERMVGEAVSDPRELLLPSAVKGAVLDLADAWPALQARLQAAEIEVENARQAASGDLLTVSDRAELEAALQAYEASNASAKVSVAIDAVTERQRALDSALAALAPWTGDIVALCGISPPGAEILSAWRQSLDEANAAIKRAAVEASEAASHAAEKQAQIDAISASIQSLDDASFAGIIKERDALWASHRAALDNTSADAFERLMEKSDAAQAARFANASTVASEAAAREAFAISNARAIAATKRGAIANLARDNVLSCIKKEVEGIGIKQVINLDRLETWITARSITLAAADAVIEAEAQQKAAERDVSQLRERFMGVLGADVSLPALASLARSRLDSDRDGRIAAQQLTKRTKEREDHQADVASWQDQWASALNDVWLAPMQNSVQSIKAALLEHDALAPDIAALERLERRIGGIEDNLTAFQNSLAVIYRALAEEMPAGDPLQSYAALQARVNAAMKDNAERIRLQEEIDTAAARCRLLEAQVKSHQGEAQKTLKILETKDLQSASRVLSEIQSRTQLREKLNQLVRAILDPVGGDDIVVAVATLDAIDRNTLAADLEAANVRVEAAKDEALQAYTANRDIDLALDRIGGDAAAAEIAQQQQTVIEEITDGARRYLRLKLGAMAAADALEQYRASHQSGMLAGASSAFAEITRGAYSGLKTQTGKKSEELIALTADGASRLNDTSMSTGTRAQLYLALRIAAYHEFSARQAPPPFVADDIFETFDDGRAEVTFQLLGEMAEKGQVIYFTHHQHLKAIAERAVPGARWLDLTAIL